MANNGKNLLLEIITNLKDVLQNTSPKLSNIQIQINENRMVDEVLTTETIELLKKIVPIQVSLIEEINRQIPEIKNPVLLNFDEILEKARNKQESLNLIKNNLNDFMCLHTKNIQEEEKLNGFKAKAQEIINNLTLITQKEDFEKYIIFAHYAKSMTIPSSKDHFQIIFTFFGFELGTALCNKEIIYLKDSSNKSPTFLNSSNESKKPKYAIFSDKVKKEEDFGVKKFENEASDKYKGKLMLSAIAMLSHIKVYPAESTNYFIKNDLNSYELIMNRLVSQGYLAKVQNIETNRNFYIFSSYGTQIFVRSGSRELLSKISNLRVLREKDIFTSENDGSIDEQEFEIYLSFYFAFTELSKMLKDLNYEFYFSYELNNQSVKILNLEVKKSKRIVSILLFNHVDAFNDFEFVKDDTYLILLKNKGSSSENVNTDSSAYDASFTVDIQEKSAIFEFSKVSVINFIQENFSDSKDNNQNLITDNKEITIDENETKNQEVNDDLDNTLELDNQSTPIFQVNKNEQDSNSLDYLEIATELLNKEPVERYEEITKTKKEQFIILIKLLIAKSNDDSPRVSSENIVLFSRLNQALLLAKTLYNESVKDKASSDLDYLEYQKLYNQLNSATNYYPDDNIYSVAYLKEIFEKGSQINPVLFLTSIIFLMFNLSSQNQDSQNEYFLFLENVFNHYDANFDFEGAQDVKTIFNYLKELSIQYFDKDFFSKKHLEGISDSKDVNQRLSQLVEKLRTSYDYNVNIDKNSRDHIELFVKYLFETNDVKNIVLFMKDEIDRKRIVNKAVFDIPLFKSLDENKWGINNQNIKKFVEDEYYVWESNLPPKIKKNSPNAANITKKAENKLKTLLELFLSWNELAVTNSFSKEEQAFYDNVRYQKTNLSKLIAEAAFKIKNNPNTFEKAIISYCLHSISNELNNSRYNLFYGDTLRTGFWRIDDNFAPKFNTEFNLSSPIFFEPWRLVMLHILEKPLSIDQIEKNIKTIENEFYCDNYGQLKDILKFKRVALNQITNDFNNKELFDLSFGKLVSINVKNIEGELDYALAVNRITRSVQEEAAAYIKSYLSFTKDFLHNIGFMKRFLDILISKNIQFKSGDYKKAILERIKFISESHQYDDNNQEQEFKAKLKIIQDEVEVHGNFLIAEQNLNKLDSKDNSYYDINEVLKPIPNLYGTFVKNKEVNKFLNIIKNLSIDDFVDFYRNNKKQFNPENVDDSIVYSMITSLSRENYGQNYDVKECKKFLEDIGFTIDHVVNETSYQGTRVKNTAISKKYLYFEAHVKKFRLNGNRFFPHPFSTFGTKASDLNIMFLFDKIAPNELGGFINTFNFKEKNNVNIIVCNWAYTHEERRKISYKFFTDPYSPTDFLLFDWTLLIHLISKGRIERFKTFLGCTLPLSSKVNPFVKQGNDSIDDDIFTGRKEEIDSLISLNGDSFIYGGKKLGKTALLLRAQNIFNGKSSNNGKKFVAIIVNVYNTNTLTSFFYNIKDEFIKADLITKESISNDFKELFKELGQNYNLTWNFLILMIDEVDRIIHLLKESNYQLISEFIHLRQSTNNNFKFVLVGLHNLTRLVKSNNSPVTQLGVGRNITPLSTVDALNLLYLPLSFLGFSFNEKTLLNLLINTMYYPGIIHIAGHSIISEIRQNYSEFVKDNEFPPYSLDDTQIARIIKNSNMNQAINNQIMATLTVDETYPHYYVLALIIGHWNYENFEQGKHNIIARGITNADITSLINDFASFKEFENSKLSVWKDIPLEQTTTYLDEMVSMKILHKPNEDDNRYSFSTKRILEALGKNSDDIFRKMNEHFGTKK
jgi:hypothetical protein